MRKMGKHVNDGCDKAMATSLRISKETASKLRDVGPIVGRWHPLGNSKVVDAMGKGRATADLFYVVSRIQTHSNTFKPPQRESQRCTGCIWLHLVASL